MFLQHEIDVCYHKCVSRLALFAHSLNVPYVLYIQYYCTPYSHPNLSLI